MSFPKENQFTISTNFHLITLGMKYIAKLIKRNPLLKDLPLNFTRIGDKGIKYVVFLSIYTVDY